MVSHYQSSNIKCGRLFFYNAIFFPEYTNHGLLHVNRVLELCDKLITKQTLAELETREIAILVISAITHDISMFIEKDGFNILLSGSRKNYKVDILDKLTWGELWDDYYKKICRYSGKKLMRIFGEAEPVKPLSNLEDITYKERLMIGDFLRLYHSRLSYEMIVDGFFGFQILDILRDTTISQELRIIIALISRSHGMKIRDTHKFLEYNFVPHTVPKNIHVFYLMSVLRMADYLDAGYNRASHVIHAMQSKKSVTSIEEYSWNRVIDYDDYVWNKKNESLMIHAVPQNSNQFLKIESWLLDLQKELDLCWAVIGEYYSGNTNYVLSIRRINSNILDERTRIKFEEKFVTKKAILDTDPDILKLLIYPLYNEDARFGIRELIQNAVDACNERKILEIAKGNLLYTPEISININTEESLIVIEDNGVGMTSDVIINYYLISGSSFRNSELWEKNFYKNNSSIVSRTGKFGIGVLATFLLGNYAIVTTRNLNDNRGFTFDIEIQNENIDIERIDSDIGTKIKIQSNNEIIDYIINNQKFPKWNDWYCFDSPIIKYYVNEVEYRHIEEYIPNEDEEINNWYTLNVAEFRSFKWSYDYPTVQGINAYCNGIPIPNGCVLNANKYGFPLSNPVISLVDYDNIANINLARSELIKFPCEREFLQVGYQYALAQLVKQKDISSFYSCCKMVHNKFPLGKEYGLYNFGSTVTSSYLFSNVGFTLFSPAFLCNLKVKKVVLVCIKSMYSEAFELTNMENPIWLCTVGERKRRSFFIQAFKNLFNNDERVHSIVEKFIVEQNFYDTELKDLFLTERLLSGMSVTDMGDNYYEYSIKNDIVDEQITITNAKEFIDNGALALLSFDLTYTDSRDDLMLQLLNKYMPEGWIPYNYDERVIKLKDIFEDLHVFI